MSTIHLTTPAAALAAIPVSLGCIPTESLVIMGTDALGRLIVSLRIDITDAHTDQAQHIAEILYRNEIRTVTIAAITDSYPGRRHPSYLPITDAFDNYDIETRAFIQTRALDPAGKVWVDHLNHRTGMTTDYRDSALTAAAVANNRIVHPDTAAMKELLTPTTTAPAHTKPIDAAATITTVLNTMTSNATATPELAAELAATAATSKNARDALLCIVGHDAAAAAEIFRTSANMLTGTNRANLLTLAAVAYYLSGQGALLNATIEAATTSTRELPSLLRLIDTTASAGVPPHVIKDELLDKALIAAAELGYRPDEQD